MLSFVLLATLFPVKSVSALPLAVAPVSGTFAALRFPAVLSKTRIRSLLQDFVDAGYGRRFRHIGDQRDFDHGHLLFDVKTGAPVAILYHTQELAHKAASADFGYLDPEGRNWIQWLDGRGIENARRYERASYPHSATWEWFVVYDLPKFRGRHTITEKMLDPASFGGEALESFQWTFTRLDCAAAAADAGSNVIDVSLPEGGRVCLALGAS